MTGWLHATWLDVAFAALVLLNTLAVAWQRNADRGEHRRVLSRVNDLEQGMWARHRDLTERITERNGGAD